MDNHPSRFSRFIAGKGFYAALAVCLIGTSAAAWAALDSAQPAAVESGISLSSSGAAQAPVNAPVSDVTVPTAEGPEAPAVTESAAPVTAPAPAESIPVQAVQEEVIVVDTLFPAQEPVPFMLPAEGEVFGVFSEGELVRNLTLGEWRTHDGGRTSITSGLDPAVAVRQGDSIRAGDTLGVVGDLLAEISMDSHIHFGMKENGSWIDPMSAMEEAAE